MRTRTPFWIRAAVVALIAVTSACTSLLGDFEVGGGDGQQGGCQTTQKTCGGQCVSKDDATVGCALSSCDPCPARPNATASCTGGACSFTCNAGFADCDANPENGCEKNVSSDPQSCGGCGKTCGDNNTTSPPRCENSQCVFDCRPAFGHCGTVDSAGCETSIATSAEHCGRCGHSCLGGACMLGRCQPFQLASVPNAAGLAIDAQNVYFTTNAPLIGRVGRDGKCNPATPCPQDFAGTAVGDSLAMIRGPSAIVSDGTFVWWMNQANGNLGRRAVTPPLAPISNFGNATSNQVGYLVLAGGKIFWTDAFENSTGGVPHVYRANPDGSMLEVVANYPAPSSTFNGFGGITADATQVFWASQNTGVWRAAFNAAACVEQSGAIGACTAVSGGGGAFGIAVDANFVYWTEPNVGTANAGSIRRAPKNGGASALVATGQDVPRAIAVMDGFVYWGNQGSASPPVGSIRRAPAQAAFCTGNACELVAPVEAPEAIVAGSDGLYWTNRIAMGGVFRLAK